MRSLRTPLLAVLFSLVAFSGCERSSRPPSAANFRGVVIVNPLTKPDLVLTDAHGRAFDLRKETAGKVTLLFFGYTHCPDVCPLHTANVAAVLKQLPFEERSQITFVFVTTDPERDTPERLREWLSSFDPTFVGLTGPLDEINRAMASLGLPPAQRDTIINGAKDYYVGHAAQVFAFGKDDLARLEYPFGIRQEDWAKDLPRLARGESPPANAADSVDAARLSAARARTNIVTAVIPEPAATATEAALYLRLENLPPDDTLIAVSSPIAKHVMMHQTVTRGGRMIMEPRERVPISADGSLEFKPGDIHVMLTELTERPKQGGYIPISFTFAHRKELIFGAMVVPYAELDAYLKRTAR